MNKVSIDIIVVTEPSKKQCKHEDGWFIKEPSGLTLWIDDKGKLFFDNQHGREAKLRAVCNNPSCSAYRNIYIMQGFGVRYGRTHRAKKVKE